jgi:hypothetical protein
MRGMGKLMAMLNPLDQSAMSQIAKSTAGKGMFARSAALAGAGAKQILHGGYFRGRTATAMQGGIRSRAARPQGMGPVGLGSVGSANRARYAATVGSTRKYAAIGAGAWAGLNILAPNSNLTGAANIVGGAGLAVGMGGPIQRRWGTRGRNMWYAGAGAYGAGKMFGVI